MENERRTKKLEWRSLSGGGETKKIKVPVIDALGRAFIFFLVTFIGNQPFEEEKKIKKRNSEEYSNITTSGT